MVGLQFRYHVLIIAVWLRGSIPAMIHAERMAWLCWTNDST